MEEPAEDTKTPTITDNGLNLKPSQLLTIIGWPKAGTTGGRPEVLEHGDVELLTNDVCNERFPEVMIIDEMMCAGGIQVDACKGRLACQICRAGFSGGDQISSLQVLSGQCTAKATTPHVLWGPGGKLLCKMIQYIRECFSALFFKVMCLMQKKANLWSILFMLKNLVLIMIYFAIENDIIVKV